MSTQNFNPNIVRSDQGGSRNLFLDYENKLSNVTLVFVDDKHFCAHKGSKIQNQYEKYALSPKILVKKSQNIKVWFGYINFDTFWSISWDPI